ncbi:16895_t:CDS:2 [Gigaspora rosea]|nr:16895_t:CDS:2 [Gigaspora rosea]
MAKESKNESDEEESEEENNGNVELIEREEKEELVEDESDKVELIEGENKEVLVEDENDKVEEESNEMDGSDETEEEEKGLSVVAPFFDDNAQVRKSNYYNNIKKHLKTIIHQALSMDLYQEEQEPAVLILSEFDNTNTSLLSNTNNQQILMFSSLMSMCYKSLHKVEISSYNSELYRRMSLRFLYEFELAYCYIKDFVMKYTNYSKGMKSTTQTNALLTGRITLQQLLDIQNTTSETFLVHQPIKQKKKKLVTLDEISINIPGFCVELLKALNDNWVILDLVDYTTITWLANIKKDE